ncbi:6-phosphofructokinase [Dubosiella newyorkensis]|uniref:6-phosphofructokinase n=1 Tax=Dubosiella newyorkensis TaxID=1862672 RepID=UPI00272AF1F9|nr:ATP-dependent 6-phosphofructokinase [Dubosiella newyorkensis]
MLRVGMLTSGGDCQALNATMRAIYKSVKHNAKEPVEIYGFIDGYKGLMYNNFKMLRGDDFASILTVGGTILGTSRTPFKDLDKPDEKGNDKVKLMKKTYKVLELDCLVVLGGNGSIKTANRLSEEGLNVIAMPKTIDNDLWGTDMTFGFQSAVDIATRCIDEIHTTASSHGRVFIVELMGHKTGWLPLNAGIAGGADIILLPEIPYDLDQVVKVVENKKTSNDGHFMIIVVAEGAMSKEDRKLSKKEYKERLSQYMYPSVSYKLAAEIEELTGREVRVTVPGHTQRGGAPDAYDRVFASRLGSEAGKLICDRKYGYMVAYKNREIIKVPLKEVAGKLKLVQPDASIIEQARMLGISFGDEQE